MAQLTEQSAELTIVSFNMHGFNQGSITVDDLIIDFKPSIILLQEHWLTPANLNKFDKYHNYFTFGCSAMDKVIESGMLKGRPFGGVLMMINSDLRSISKTIYCSERFCIVKISDSIFINVYLPCKGTINRLGIIEDLFAEIWAWRERYASCECFIAGDLNVDLDSADNISQCVNNFISMHALLRCDLLTGKAKTATYVNDALNQYSTIDYMLVSCADKLRNFEVLDPDINFSDHLPIMATYTCSEAFSEPNIRSNVKAKVAQLRWDHADLISYYHSTGYQLQPVLDELNDCITKWNMNCDDVNYVSIIDKSYNNIVNTLTSCANYYVPQRAKNFYKFWWNEELKILKNESIESNQVWKDAGKPRSGPIFLKRQACRLRYRKRIRENQKSESVSFTNDLNDALLQKKARNFGNVGTRSSSPIILIIIVNKLTGA